MPSGLRSRTAWNYKCLGEARHEDVVFGESTSDVEPVVNGVVSCAVELADLSPMPVGAHRNWDGQPVACVDIAYPVVSLYGSAAAMRRLAGAATRAAEQAERSPPPEPVGPAPAFRRPLAFAEDAGDLPKA
jgi:hypothetical protein